MVVENLQTTHADEIMLSPGASAQDAPPQDSANGTNPTNDLQSLSNALIERVLDDVDLNYCRDREGDMFTVFSGDDLPGDLVCWHLITGENKDIFRILCTVDRPLPKEKWRRALLACNQHHGSCRLGRCYLTIKEGHPEAKLFFESLVDLSEGVTETYLQRFIMLSLLAAHVFFERTCRENGLFPTRSKKRHTTKKHEVTTQP